MVHVAAAAAATLAAGNPRARGVVFIDAHVSDAQRLVDGLLPGLAVQRLDSDRDGVAQITEYLQRHPAQAVHLVCHGGPGMLRLGKALLNVSTLATYAPALRSWFGGLPGAQKLVIYGCRVAAGEAETAFLAQIHALTGAMVAASPQVVGNGHWPLRTYYPVAAHPGAVLAFDAHTQATYPATLAITVSLDQPSVGIATEADTTVITIAALTGGVAVSGDQTVVLNVSGAGLTPDDYILSNGGIITIPDGQTQGSITLTVANDALVEGTEIAFLSLSNPSAGLTLIGDTRRLDLIDNDTLAVTVAAGTSPTEGGTPGTYTLTLERPAPVGGLTVNYRLRGTATAADYTLAPGTNITTLTGTTFTIAEGETTATVLVNASADAIVDPNETVRLSLLAGAGYTLGGYDPTNPLTAADPVAVQDSPQAAALGDFNKDGILDMAVANFSSNTVSIRLGDGQGGFGGTTNVAVGTQPRSVALGDFNKDGNLDMAVANRGANTVSILLGNGNGAFSAATNIAVGTSPQSVVVGDFDNDGDPDLAIANNGSANVSLLLGNGNGTFGPATNVAVGTQPSSVALGDFNNDGKADLVTANTSSGDVSLLLGNGNGTFSPTTPLSGFLNLRAVAVGDLNNDGNADLAVSLGSNVSFFLGNGLGGFSRSPESRVVLGNLVFSMVIGDFNGDGNADIAGAFLTGNTVISYLGNGLGYFTDRTQITVGIQPVSLAAGDLNGDGTLDFVTANGSGGGSGTASVLLNTLPSAGLTITDVPSVNLSVSATAGTEAGTTVITVTATASAAVVGNQTVSLGVSGTGITAGDYTLSNGVITIANGATTGSVTFTVVDDALVEGPETVTLTISNPSAGITLGTTTTQTIALTDNDTAGVIITQSGGTTALTEGGATDTYTVVLNSQPTANVTITIGNDGQSSTVPTSLTFTAANWSVAQTVTVTAVDDAVAESNHNSTLTHTATSADTFYNGIVIDTVTAAITDNDAAGVSVVQSDSSTVISEGGATDTYTVVLTSQPTDDVLILIGNDGQASTDATSLTFTAANWNVAQTITVSAVDDATTEGNHTGTLTLTAKSADGFYNGLAINTVTAFITDNDTPPTTGNASVTLAEDAVFVFNSGLFPFADADAGDTLQSLRITQLPTVGQLFLDADNDNAQGTGEAVTADQDIAVAALSQLKFKPAANANGAAYASFQFQVSDGRFLSAAPGTLTLNVTPVNDAPTGSVTLGGTATQGQTLTAANTLADLDGLGPITYQWQADGVDITGANGTTLLLSQAQVGKAITVKASYIDGFQTPEAVVSIPTSPVTAPTSPGPTSPGPTSPSPTSPSPNPPQITPLPNQLLAVTGDSPTRLTVNVTTQGATSVLDIAVVVVDDAEGRINGLLPSDSGYGAAAIARANTLMSVLRSGDFAGQFGRRSLPIAPGQFLQLALVQGGTLDDLKRGGAGQLFFATGAANGNGQSIVQYSALGQGYAAAFTLPGASSPAVTVQLGLAPAPAPVGSQSQGLIPQSELLDLTGMTSPTATLSFEVFREATFNNIVGFYVVEDSQGRVRDTLTGTLIAPGEAGYQQAALANRVGSNLAGQNGQTLTYSATVATGKLLSTFLVVNSTLDTLLDTNPGNDPTVFFNHIAANGDGQDHVRLLGDNTFGFEDISGGGDRDFNDVIVKVAVA